MPTSALTEISRTIKSLNMSYNQIEHIDSTMFSNIPQLLSLSLRENKVYPNLPFARRRMISTLLSHIELFLLYSFSISIIANLTTTQRFCWCTSTSNVGFIAQQESKRRLIGNAKFCTSPRSSVFR